MNIRVAINRGMTKSKIQTRASGIFFWLRKGEVKPIQFLETPEQFVEYYVHQFQDEEDRWRYIPCLVKRCPLCREEGEAGKRRYRFATNVWNVLERKVQILEGGTQLGALILQRYERRPSSFLDRIFDLGKLGRTPVMYDLVPTEDRGLDESKRRQLKLHDVESYIQDQAIQYYGQGDEDEEREIPHDEKEDEEEDILTLTDKDDEEEEAEEEEIDEAWLDSLDEFLEDEEESPKSPRVTRAKSTKTYR